MKVLGFWRFWGRNLVFEFRCRDEEEISGVESVVLGVESVV